MARRPELISTIIFDDSELSVAREVATINATRIAINTKNLDVELERESHNINSSHTTNLRKINDISVVTTDKIKADIAYPSRQECDANGRIIASYPVHHKELDAEIVMYDQNDPENILIIEASHPHRKQKLRLNEIDSIELTAVKLRLG